MEGRWRMALGVGRAAGATRSGWQGCRRMRKRESAAAGRSTCAAAVAAHLCLAVLDLLQRSLVQHERRGPRRRRQALLATGVHGIDGPGVGKQRHAAQRGHRVNQKQRAVLAAHLAHAAAGREWRACARMCVCERERGRAGQGRQAGAACSSGRPASAPVESCLGRLLPACLPVGGGAPGPAAPPLSLPLTPPGSAARRWTTRPA